MLPKAHQLSNIDKALIAMLRYRARTGKKYFSREEFRQELTVEDNWPYRGIEKKIFGIEQPGDRYFVLNYYSQVRFIGQAAAKLWAAETVGLETTLELDLLIEKVPLNEDITNAFKNTLRADLSSFEAADYFGLTLKEYITLEDVFFMNLGENVLRTNLEPFKLIEKPTLGKGERKTLTTASQ